MNRSPNCHRTSHHNIFGARAQLIARSHYCCSYSLVNFVLLHVNKQMEMQFLPRRGITSNQHITAGTLVMISAPVTTANTGAAPLMSPAPRRRRQCLHLAETLRQSESIRNTRLNLSKYPDIETE